MQQLTQPTGQLIANFPKLKHEETVLSADEKYFIYILNLPNQELAISCWADKDDNTDREIIIPVTKDNISHIKEHKISVQDTLNNSGCYLVDIENITGTVLRVWKVQQQDISQSLRERLH